MAIDDVKVSDDSGTIEFDVRAIDFPQTCAGVLWHYDRNKVAIGAAGTFSARSPRVPAGQTAAIVNEFFQVEGAVLPLGGPVPQPYRVQIRILQLRDSDGTERELARKLIPTDAPGQLNNDPEPFAWSVHIVR